MLKNFVPDFCVKTIADIDLKRLRDAGMTAMVLDLDNTLDSHNTITPSPQALHFLDSVLSENFLVCVISNGKHARVSTYLHNLSIPFVANAGKPLKKSYYKALDILNVAPERTVFVGDQIFTDVWGANRVGLTTILTEPIEQFENAFFYIKRGLEKIVKRKIAKE